MPLVVNRHGKFDVSRPNRSQDMEGSQNLKKLAQMTNSRLPLIQFCTFSLVPLVVNLHAKFEVSGLTVPEIWRGPKFKK